MSLETSLYTVLYALGTKVYPDVAPSGAACPFITWQQVGGEAPVFVERAEVSKRNALVQVNTWATTRAAANALALQVESALVTAGTFQAKPFGAFIATHDTETNEYGTIQTFSIWCDR